MNVRTIFVGMVLTIALVFRCGLASGQGQLHGAGERVVFIIAEDEYDAANTLPEFAGQLEDVYGLTCEIVQGGDNNIAGLERLAEADLAVIYVRRQVLPAGQMKHLRDYVASGKPVVGLRTASHSFCLHEERPPAGFEEWGEFDRDVLGGNYHMHHGNKDEDGPFTYVWVKKGMESHPIFTGIPSGEFRVPSWLYKTSPLADSATVLMMGRVGNRKPFEPVAWSNTHTGGGRVFYTSLGHPDEFKMRVFRTLLTNGIFWALDKQVPSPEMMMDKLVPKIAGYDFGHSRKWLTFTEELVLQTQDYEIKRGMARRLAKLLVEPGTSFACKEWICQQLSIIGSQEHVLVLVDMLTDEKLSDMARFALERIPSYAADGVLSSALNRTSGKVRVGIINSIGNRRNGEAVQALGKLLSDPDRESAEAAAVALGLIGSRAAASELKRELGKASGKWRQVQADAYLLCADNLRADGDNETAIEIYARMYAPSEAKHVRITAFKGLVSTDKTEAIPHVIKELKSDDAAMRSVALGFVRELRGKDATEAFCKESPKLGEEGCALLVSALGDRGDRLALPAVMQAAQSEFESVRVAALEAMGTIGDARAVELLAQKAATGENAERTAARRSLNLLRGVEINWAIMELLDAKDASVRLEAVKSLGARKATEAVGKLLRTAEDGDPKIRAESWKALAALGGRKDLAAMIGLWVKIEGDGERKAAEDAVVAVGRKRSQKEAAAAIVAAMDSVKDVNRKGSLLRALGRIGDETALPILRAGLKDKDSEIKAAAIRALSSWPSAEPMEDLRDLARGAEEEQHKVLALRGYIKMIEHAERTAGQKVRLYSEAMDMSGRVDEKRLVLAGLASVAHIEALKAAESYLTDTNLKSEAAAAVVAIADKMDEANEIEDEATRQYILSVLRKVVEVSENESAVEDVAEVIERISN